MLHAAHSRVTAQNAQLALTLLITGNAYGPLQDAKEHVGELRAQLERLLNPEEER